MASFWPVIHLYAGRLYAGPGILEGLLKPPTIFSRSFPSGWSGSLADILEVRSEAFADLLNHVSPEVREIARTKLSLLNRSIRENREREAEEYNRREQRFE